MPLQQRIRKLAELDRAELEQLDVYAQTWYSPQARAEQREVHDNRGRVHGRQTTEIAHAHDVGSVCGDSCEVWDWAELESEAS